MTKPKPPVPLTPAQQASIALTHGHLVDRFLIALMMDDLMLIDMAQGANAVLDGRRVVAKS